MATTLQIPPANVPLMARDGSLDNRWRAFFLAIIDRSGGILGGLQPEDDTLTALAALNAAAGFLVQTGADAFTKRSLAVTAGELSLVNPAGTAGNPTLGLAAVAGVAGTHLNPTSITVDGKGRITAIS